MNAGDVVVVHCAAPREKFWGVLRSLNATGVILRAVPLEAFEDYLRQVASHGAQLLGPITLFLPAHRIERIELDENAGVAEGLAVRFRRATGRDPADVLDGEEQPSSPGD